MFTSSAQLKSNDTSDLTTPEEQSFIEQVNASIYGGWDSHYFTEGRDLLEGDSLIINQVQAYWEFLSWNIWYAASPEQSYDELQLMAALTKSIGNYTFYAGYRHIQFPSDDLTDDEVAVGIAASNLPAEFQIAVDAYHSFEANGFFVEISISRSFTITESFNITGAGIFGINQGYVGDGHDGANHLALTLGSNYEFSKSISIVARLTQSWAINRDSSLPGDAQLVNFFNGGIGVQWSL